MTAYFCNLITTFVTSARSCLEAGIYFKALWYCLVSHSPENQFNAKANYFQDTFWGIWCIFELKRLWTSMSWASNQMLTRWAAVWACASFGNQAVIWILCYFAFLGGILRVIWHNQFLCVLVISVQGDAQRRQPHVSNIQ